MKLIYLILICFALCGSGNCKQPNIQFATWFSRESCIKEGNSGITASGKSLDDSALWCALPFHPPKVNGKRQWGQEYILTNLSNGRKIIVQHWDFGPGKQAQAKNVVIDLTPAAMIALAGQDGIRKGRIRVSVEKCQ